MRRVIGTLYPGFMRGSSSGLWDPRSSFPLRGLVFPLLFKCLGSRASNPPPRTPSLALPGAGSKYLNFQIFPRIPRRHLSPLQFLAAALTVCSPRRISNRRSILIVFHLSSEPCMTLFKNLSLWIFYLRGKQETTTWNMLYEIPGPLPPGFYLSYRNRHPMGSLMDGCSSWETFLGDRSFQHSSRSVLPLPMFVTLKRFFHLRFSFSIHLKFI